MMKWINISLLPLAIIFCLIYLATGETFLSIDQLWTSLSDATDTSWTSIVLRDIRLPRLVLILLTGASLAVSGFVMQTLVANPMADPYLLGTSSGASLGATISVLMHRSVGFIGTAFSGLLSFTMALIASLICISIAGKGKNTSLKLILSGLSISSISMALVSLLIYLSSEDDKIRQVVFWTLGSFDTVTWAQLSLLAPVLFLVLIVQTLGAQHLYVLMLGNEKAAQLGVSIKKVRWVALISVVLLTSLTVSIAGPVGFIGLMVPHITRLLNSSPSRWNIARTALHGGFFLLIADWIGRLIIPSTGLPASLIMSITGVPFLLWLMNKKMA